MPVVHTIITTTTTTPVITTTPVLTLTISHPSTSPPLPAAHLHDHRPWCRSCRPLTAMTMHPTQEILIGLTQRGHIRTWNTADLRPGPSFRFGSHHLTALAYNTSASHLAVATSTGMLPPAGCSSFLLRIWSVFLSIFESFLHE